MLSITLLTLKNKINSWNNKLSYFCIYYLQTARFKEIFLTNQMPSLEKKKKTKAYAITSLH